MNPFKSIKNYWFPTNPISGTDGITGVKTQDKKHLGNFIAPVQLQRIRQDIQTWRGAINSAELAYYPQRVKMQQLYNDTVLNGHVYACMLKRKSLTAQKKIIALDAKGNEIEEMTKFFDKRWLDTIVDGILDAQFYGYTLMNWDGIEGSELTNIKLIRRANVSPDRLNVTSYLYALSGLRFQDPEYIDWNIYTTTPSEIGISPCGYGLLYRVAPYEIMLRNIFGYNGDFVEIYGMPLRIGKTVVRDGEERDAFEQALANFGANPWMIIDPADEVDFVDSKAAGTGYKSYESFEERCEKKISKLILGHADAMDSTPGKLGAEDSVREALEVIENNDSKFIQHELNYQLLPKLANLGFKFPAGMTLAFDNNHELQETRAKEDASNQLVANIAVSMASAGLKMDAKYFTERTGIPTTDIPKEEPVIVGNKDIQNRINEYYD